ncbi:MAG: hypothetical protein ACRDS0_12280 [Pseudonocardiaceae bacterium]
MAVVLLLIPAHSFALTDGEPSPSPSPEEPSPASSAKQTVTLNPDRGPPGTKIRVNGSGFGGCGNSVKLSWNTDSKNADVGTNGKFDADLKVSIDAKPGPLKVTATSGCGDENRTFTVVTQSMTRPAPPPPVGQPSPVTPTSPATSPTAAERPAAAPPDDNFTKNEHIAEQELRPGSILYNPPEQMRVGEAEQIEVRITRQLSADIYKDLKGRGPPRVEESPITADMKVELIGDPEAFDIRAMSSPVQSVFGSYTEWYWNVTPLSSGIHSLSIKATFLYQGQTFKDLPPFERRIEVAVNPLYSTKKWFGGNWTELLAVLGIPSVFTIGTALYKRRRNRLINSSGESQDARNPGE